MATKTKTVLEQEVEAMEAKAQAPKEPFDPMKEMRNIYIPKLTGKGDNFVFVSLNGKNYQIQRGVQVAVPMPVALILEESYRAEARADAYLDSISRS